MQFPTLVYMMEMFLKIGRSKEYEANSARKLSMTLGTPWFRREMVYKMF